MLTIQAQLSDLILEGARLAQKAGALPTIELPTQIRITHPKRLEWGDFASRLPIQLARQTRADALDIARKIQEYLPSEALISWTSISPPGYINVKLASAWLSSQVRVVLEEGPGYACQDFGSGQKAQVEFGKINPIGPLSVGQGRGCVIGDTLANMLLACGYQVNRTIYVNNTSAQMHDLADSLQLRYLQALGHTVEFPTYLYQRDDLIDLGFRLAEDHGDKFSRKGWEHFKDQAETAIMENIRKTLSRLNICFDVAVYMNSLYENGAVWVVIEELQKRGYLYEIDGGLWFMSRRLGGSQDRALLKPDGNATTLLPDIAHHFNKLERGFNLVVDVYGTENKETFQEVIRALQVLGCETSSIRLLLNQLVILKDNRISLHNSRFMTLDQLIEQAGAETVRFMLLMRPAESHLEFDLNQASNHLDLNPMRYVQNSFARISSFLNQASEQGFQDKLARAEGEVSLLTHPLEQALILRVLELPNVIACGAIDLAPHYLATYLLELVTAFRFFDRDCLVFAPGHRQRNLARLMLVEATRIALERSLELLGICPTTETQPLHG